MLTAVIFLREGGDLPVRLVVCSTPLGPCVGVWWPSRGFACGSPAVIEKFDPFGAAALAVTRRVADQSSVLSAVPWRVAGLSSVLSAVPRWVVGLSSVLSAVPWRMAGLSSVLSAVPWRVADLSSVLSAVPWRVAGLSSVLSAVPWRVAGLSSVLSAARRPHYSITAGKPQAHPRNGTSGRMWAPRGSNARGGIWRELVSGAARWQLVAVVCSTPLGPCVGYGGLSAGSPAAHPRL